MRDNKLLQWGLIIAFSILICIDIPNLYAADIPPIIDPKVIRELDQSEFIRVLIKLKEPNEAPLQRRFSTAKQKERFISKSNIRKLQKRFKSRINSRALTSNVSRKHSFSNLPLVCARIDAKGLAALKYDPNVARITADFQLHSSLAESGPLIQSPEVHSYGYTGEGVTVAVIDSGIDTDQPGLADDLIWEECFLTDGGCSSDPDSIRDSGPGSAESEANSHGTHVSSIITSGDTAYPGIAPDAGIVALRVLDRRGYGYYSDILIAIDWAITNKDTYNIRVVNLSLGGYVHYSNECDEFFPIFRDAADAAIAAEINVFAASGNRAIKSGLPVPACLSSVTSVGAVYDSDLGGKDWRYCSDSETEADQVVCFSNSSTELDLLAPGSEITAAGAYGPFTMSSTSQASPYAAAAAALLLEKDSAFTPAEIETILKDSGVEVRDPINGFVYSRIDLLAALKGVRFAIVLPNKVTEGGWFAGGAGKCDDYKSYRRRYPHYSYFR